MAGKSNERNTIVQSTSNSFGDALEEQKTVAEYLKDLNIKYEQELHKLRIENAKALAQTLYTAEQKFAIAGIKETQKVKKKLKQTEEKEEKLRNKKAVLELLQLTSKEKEKERQKELEHTENLIKLEKARIQGNTKAWKEAAKALQQEANKEALKKAGAQLVKDTLNEVSALVTKYGDMSTKINTRLYGSGLSKYFTSMESRLTTTVGVNPYIKQENLMDNLAKLVEEGINFNVEERAFLETLSENVATTFDVANSSLLRIVKLQQADSSAARLGMEAELTRYLNSMFEDTSYLSQSFDGVSEALLEASSQMTTENAVAFEYQVQKWLGALGSVGMSSGAISNLAQALGYLGSGNITGLNSSSMQNLLVMGASRAGLNYNELLTNGLNASTTNALMNSIVGYIQEIGASPNQVVKSQFAEAFGLSVSDLTSALNLNTDTLKNVSSQYQTYGDDIESLQQSMNSMALRVGGASMVNNLMSNAKYSIASGVANNPITSALWQVTDMIQNVTGGINIPALSTMATGFDLETTVENLMKLGIVGAGTLGTIGDVLSGLTSTVVPETMLWKLGIGKTPEKTKRGSGLNKFTGGLSVSESSTVVGNSSGTDYSDSAVNEASDSATAQVQEKLADEKTINDVHSYLTSRLDPKLDVMVRMMGSVAGYAVSSSDENYNLMMGETAVVVSQPKNSDSTGYIQSIESNIKSIATNVEVIASAISTAGFTGLNP